ncbi:NfeD family protein [Rouxiella badensis]|jgi:membrane protein implicated in regulation of membrane protease activity|uniref:NfeD-like C-terminal domain-containing protein n=1 Tax=Rouxiella badensis TaxID=1646377 RepID=A0A1X0WJ67_9GAMM|nr:NfeD family protein [Rouxiella badensis]MCC3702230.1 NfeD family protein [Rouxiella badensis]MCC3717236.1 NfeD family protein [Rouxiella badensis]MCC3728332.1 NfeD family protein [Rouxiella badensis]MCC3732236.1 NfeD family protein [Rouxiella badensis]MCC3740076.1 NfeD family protein [Rouxiella badensis]
MLQQLMASPHLFWLSLGGLLLAAEMLGASGYLLWSGVSAALVGALIWLVPLPWEWQGVAFAVLTVIAALLWAAWLKRKTTVSESNASLNQRGQQMVGLHGHLLEQPENGYSRIRIGDSTWRVSCADSLNIGEEVTVTGVEGNTLRVMPSH